MADYTTSERVLDELPRASTIPADVTGKIPGWITDASRLVDSWIVSYPTPFADIAANPSTPPVVEEVTRYLVVDRVMRKLGTIRRDDDGKAVDTYKQEAECTLRKIQTGERIIPGL
jgi:hypothetical protein